MRYQNKANFNNENGTMSWYRGKFLLTLVTRSPKELLIDTEKLSLMKQQLVVGEAMKFKRSCSSILNQKQYQLMMTLVMKCLNTKIKHLY